MSLPGTAKDQLATVHDICPAKNKGLNSCDAFNDLWADITGIRTGQQHRHITEGGEVSAAEIEFKLGDSAEWGIAQKRLEERLNEKPIVLQLDNEDRLAVTQGMPAYIAYELRYCATSVVQAPASVFQGLRKGLKRGRAYCGIPNKRFDNQGKPQLAPAGMVYVVYTDEQNYVFDWDWVQADPQHPGHPIQWDTRFNKKIDPVSAVITGIDDIRPGTFDPNHAWYSRRGNCVFVYFADAPGFAERLNEDVTIFRTTDEKILGCKIKNIDKSILEEAVGAEQFLAKSLLRQSEPREQYLRLFAEMAETQPVVRARVN